MYYIKDMKNVMELLFAEAEGYNFRLGPIGDFLEREIMPSAKKIYQGELFPRQNLEKVKEKLADMVTEINASRLLTYYAAHLKKILSLKLHRPSSFLRRWH